MLATAYMKQRIKCIDTPRIRKTSLWTQDHPPDLAAMEPIKTPLTQLLKTASPIVSAPMGYPWSVDIAVAVTQAGGYGMMGAGMLPIFVFANTTLHECFF